MIAWLKTFCFGEVIVGIYGKQREAFLELCRRNRIYFYDMTCDQSCFRGKLSIRDFKRLKPLVRRRKVQIKIHKKRGLPFWLFHNRKRKLLFISVLFSGLFLYQLSIRLWDISFEGNIYYSSEDLRESILAEKITYGMYMKYIDCDQLEKALRKHYDRITWISVKKLGTRLVVEIKENHGILSMPKNVDEPCNIVSNYDGVISSMIVRSGTAMVSIGDQVKSGDLLISGSVGLYNDSKEEYKRFYVPADGDIYIEISIPYYNIVPRVVSIKEYDQRYTSYSIAFQDLNLQIPSRIDQIDQRMETQVESFQLKLFQNYYLPVYLHIETCKNYEIQELYQTDQEIVRQLEEDFDIFSENLLKKGIQILSNNVKIETSMSEGSAYGSIRAIAPAGRKIPLEDEED